MPLTGAQSALFSGAQILALAENQSKVMQWMEFMIWYCIGGPKVRLGQVNSLPTLLPEFDTVPIDPPDIDAVPQSSQTVAEVKAIVQDLHHTATAEYLHSEIMDIAAIETAAGVRRMLYVLANTVFRGDESADSSKFNGLNVLIPPAKQLRAADLVNGYVELSDFSRLVDQHRSGDAEGQSMIVMSQRAFLNFLLAHWNAGIAVQYIRLRVQDDNGYLVWVHTPTFGGIPILLAEHSPNDMTVGTDNTWTIAYIFRIGHPGGAYFITTSCDRIVDVREQDHASLAMKIIRMYLTAGFVVESQCAAGSLVFKPRPVTLDV